MTYQIYHTIHTISYKKYQRNFIIWIHIREFYSVEELEGALEEGMGFNGYSTEWFARIDESDMVTLPDPNKFQLLPWRPYFRFLYPE